MKNNRGFTLIELLAVVVIMLAISVIAVSSISAAMERNKAKQDEAKKEVICSMAELYYEEHKNELIKNQGTGTISIDITKLDLSEEEKKKSNGDDFSGSITIDATGKCNVDSIN